MPLNLSEQEQRLFVNTVEQRKMHICGNIYLYLLDDLVKHPALFGHFERLNLRVVEQASRFEEKERQGQSLREFEKRVVRMLEEHKRGILGECKALIQESRVGEVKDYKQTQEY